MNIPHQPPIKYAAEVLERTDAWVRVLCEFPEPPTLPMMIEAAAQASAGLNPEVLTIGYLTLVQESELVQKTVGSSLVVKVQALNNLGKIKAFAFAFYEAETLIAKGSITLFIPQPSI